MPINLQSTKPISRVNIGQTLLLSETEEALVTINDMKFLKAGFTIVGEESNYPVAYAKFDNFLTPVGPAFPPVQTGTTSPIQVVVNAVEFVNGQYFAFATTGNTTGRVFIATSSDGVSWSVVYRGRLLGYTMEYLNGVYLMGAQDVFASATPYYGIYRSTNLVDWTLISSIFSTSNYIPRDSVTVGSQAVFVGDQGRIVTTDGTTATERVATGGTSQAFLSIAYGAGRYVTAQNSQATPASGGILTSTNGVNWSGSIPTGWTGVASSCVVYGNGRFVISTNIAVWFTSTDGLSWTSFPAPGTFGRGTYCSKYGFVFGCTSTGFVISPDGLNWEFIPSFTPSSTMFCAASNGTDALIGMNQGGLMLSTVKSIGLVQETATTGKTYVRIK